MPIPLLSFFTGGGFLDIGFEEGGFEIIWTNEINAQFADMHEYAMTAWRRSTNPDHLGVYISDRRSIEEVQVTEVIERAFGAMRPEVFGIIGGPPCTDFSTGGKNGGSTAKHGKLTQTYIDMICAIKPPFFVMENVPGLYLHKEHRLFFNQIVAKLESDQYDYVTDSNILKALNLGIPQDRERLFLVGFQRNWLESQLGRSVVRGARNWFPWPVNKQYADARNLNWPSVIPFGTEEVVLPDGIPLELTVYPLLVDAESMPNGQEYFVPYSEKFKLRAEGDVSSQSFKRLHRYRYSPTAWYGNNEVHLHPWRPRRLSVRETLRIQTVPDTYVLPADYPLGPKFKMICNGAPCRMVKPLAESILRFITELGRSEEVRQCNECTQDGRLFEVLCGLAPT